MKQEQLTKRQEISGKRCTKLTNELIASQNTQE